MSTKLYDQADFDKNSGKYRLFKTAKVIEEVPSAPNLKVGEIYNISYYGTAVNMARAGATIEFSQRIPLPWEPLSLRYNRP